MPVEFDLDDNFGLDLDDIDDEVDIGEHRRSRGNNNLSYRFYKNRANHPRSWYFVSPLGDPFPSYHSNPEPDFPARWTNIPGVRPPVETITAPRIRLAPNELEKRVDIIAKIPAAARDATARPHPMVLNLAHQSLGDKYQYDTLRAFIELNSTIQILNLDGNELDDICDLNLSNVKKLYLSGNNFASFSNLPTMPRLEELYLKKNFITGTHGLSTDKFPMLKKLCLFANPIEANKEYRREIKAILPLLKWIDFYDLAAEDKRREERMRAEK